MAVSIRLSNRFSPRNHFHPPVLICCQIMFASVIPARAHRARDSLAPSQAVAAPPLAGGIPVISLKTERNTEYLLHE